MLTSISVGSSLPLSLASLAYPEPMTVVTLAVVIVATVYYVIRGSSTFEGPAVRMKKAEDDSSMVAMEDIVVHGKQ